MKMSLFFFDFKAFSSDFLQGGGEALFTTSKTKEQLYIEAKDILNGVDIQKRPPPDYVNVLSANSPGSTQPRRPPRSKHDRDPNSPVPQVINDHFSNFKI